VLRRRVVVCLDVKDGRVVKGVHFEALRDVGDPVALAERYERDGADEIVFLDISASAEERTTLLDLARRTAERLFVPLTIGGGVRELEDVVKACRAGADKVSINTAAVLRPELLTEAADRFGAQCIVASIDAKRTAWRPEDSTPHQRRAPSAERPAWEVVTRGGRTATGLDAVEWARECVRRGAGEILLTSIDRDGARAGYDIELTRAVARAVEVPVVASGGAGSAEHVRAVLRDGEADAALVAGILHDGLATVGAIKRVLAADGLPVRSAA
jgi:imidazole glycerol-phosphate synthase subunit HisF